MTTELTVGRAGSAWSALGDLSAFLLDPGRYLTSLAARGDLVEIGFGSWTGYVACHPELTQRILLDDRTFAKGGPLLDKARDIVGNSLITSPRHVHRRQRRLLQPAFHRDHIPRYAAVMTDQAAAVSDSWRDRGNVDVVAEMNAISANVTLRTLFSRRVDEAVVQALVGEIKKFSEGLFLSMVLPAALDRLPVPRLRGFRTARERLRTFTARVVADYRADPSAPQDMLSLLLAARDEGIGVEDSEVIDHVISFIVAGVETTANTLAWALHLVAIHPEVERRLHAEVDDVLTGRPARYPDVANLPLTRCVITETSGSTRRPGW
ncbi:pentalenene oxygenase [Lentzea xinjiangensis]|uniref:Pentalenene oxygenase n=1 Tax=Lentzea xinjiangensis TaxID=402600 RepID=A0A1H9TRA5_9PSEU|nr:pentalenene oxygenase [Lentzea xinjiangensis]